MVPLIEQVLIGVQSEIWFYHVAWTLLYGNALPFETFDLEDKSGI